MDVADPTALTAIIGAAAGILGAAAPIVIDRRRDKHDREADAKHAAEDIASSSIESWTELNKALNREIARLHADVDRIRSDYESAMERQRREYEAALARQRTDYEEQLRDARQRITDLEADVASLRRLLSPEQGHGQ